VTHAAATTTSAPRLPRLIDRGPCPLCAAPGPFPVAVAFRHIPVVRCTRCAMLHSARIMDATDTAAYYRETFGSEFHRQGQRVNAAVNAQVVTRLFRLAGLTGPQRILDVGCGYGYLLPRLRAMGHTVRGVEPSVGESAWARERLGQSVRTGILDLSSPECDPAPNGPGRFDAAVTFEVIEHIPTPGPFVQALAAAVRPGGLLIIGTDNFASPVVDQFGPGFPKWIPHTHVCHFCPATLRRCIQSVPGLSPVGLLTYTPPENALRALLRGGFPPPPAAHAFDLASHMAAEMQRGYPLFALRQAVTALWAGLTLSSSDRGSMMFLAARREA